MFDAKGFFDYYIDKKCFEHDNYGDVVRTWYNYGYRTIAINQTVDMANVQQHQKRKKGGGGGDNTKTDILPEPLTLNTVKGCEDMKILNRLTIAFSTSDAYTKATSSPNYRKYDIIAIMPQTYPAFMYASDNIFADILTINHETKAKIKYMRKLCSALIAKGYHFEICYGPAINDRTARKNIIHLSHLFHSLTKSKNMIISSGATRAFLSRSPYDVVNLGLIFGLSEQQAKTALNYNGREVYVNSVGRRHGKTVTIVEKIPPPNQETIEVDDSIILVDDSVVKEEVKNNNEDDSIICLDDVEMSEGSPAKKVKQ